MKKTWNFFSIYLACIFFILFCSSLTWASGPSICPDNDGMQLPDCPDCSSSTGINVGINDPTNPDGEKKLVALKVTPESAELSIGESKTFVALGIYSDDSTKVITPKWSGGEGNSFTAQKPGTFTIAATYLGLSAKATIEVKGPIPTALSIEPEESTIKIGEEVSFSAVAVYKDGSEAPIPNDAIIWKPSNPFKGTEEGKYAITAEHQGVSGSATVTVKPVAAPIQGKIAGDWEFKCKGTKEDKTVEYDEVGEYEMTIYSDGRVDGSFWNTLQSFFYKINGKVDESGNLKANAECKLILESVCWKEIKSCKLTGIISTKPRLDGKGSLSCGPEISCKGSWD